MSYTESVNISAALNQLIYLIKDKGYPNNLSVSELVKGIKPTTDENIALKGVLEGIIRSNPGFGNLEMVDTSWKTNAYGRGDKPGGMYAATFESPSGDVYVSYCGTTDGNWGYNAAAFGTESSQMQAWSLAYFNQTVARNFEGQGKGNLYVTGHSQGGNNAQYVTMFSEYSEYIDRCYSMNGPGFSEEVVEDAKALWGEAYYKRQIEKMYAYNGQNDYVNQQGEVQVIPMDRTTFIGTPNSKGVVDNHSMSVMLSEKGLNGKVDEGNVSISLRVIVAAINLLPQEARYKGAQAMMALIEDPLSFMFNAAFSVTSGEFAIIVAPILFEMFTNALGLVKSVIDELVNAIMEPIYNIYTWINNTFNAGLKYSKSNPYIQVDTYKLRSYAQRIQQVNRRLSQLDRGIENLYWQVGALDLFNIFAASLLTSGSPTLVQVSSYLNETADEFEIAETKALSYLGG